MHILAVILFWQVGPAAAQSKGNKGKVSYTFTSIDPPGSTSTDARGINDVGQVAGSFIAGGSGPHGFLFDGTSFVTFDVPGVPSGTLAFGINGSGQIVGAFSDAGGQHGFLRNNDATFTAINVPGSLATEALGVNAASHIVGIFIGSPIGTNVHGFLFDGTTFTTIDVPSAAGGAFTLPWGINDRGQIVGWFADSNLKEHGFLFDAGTFTIFDVPGAVTTEAFGIDACGRIVGTFVDALGVPHGFLKRGARYTTIDVSGALTTHAEGISETTGQIVGFFTDSTGTAHGFLATPTRRLRGHCLQTGKDEDADELDD